MKSESSLILKKYPYCISDMYFLRQWRKTVRHWKNRQQPFRVRILLLIQVIFTGQHSHTDDSERSLQRKRWDKRWVDKCRPNYLTIKTRGVLIFLKFWHYSPEHKETGSLGATESEAWIDNFNVKVWKTTKHKHYKIWRSLKFCKNSRKQAHSRRNDSHPDIFRFAPGIFSHEDPPLSVL